MFFKNYFNSVADILESKYSGHTMNGQNPADKGEICELFLKEFLIDSLGDNFKIFRGGKIVDNQNNQSKQLDIVLCGKRTVKIFGDKGIYPTETTYGVFSVTSTLNKQKLRDCILEFESIPKKNHEFTMERFVGVQYVKETQQNWMLLFPYKCVFAYRGSMDETWISEMDKLIQEGITTPDKLPDMIIINKKGMIEKSFNKEEERYFFRFHYLDFNLYPNHGVCFSKILFHLYNLSSEEYFLKPRYEFYFNSDM